MTLKQFASKPIETRWKLHVIDLLAYVPKELTYLAEAYL